MMHKTPCAETQKKSRTDEERFKVSEINFYPSKMCVYGGVAVNDAIAAADNVVVLVIVCNKWEIYIWKKFMGVQFY